ncbi:histone modifying enzyme [Lithospermum erythrorhizon]|uniref:Histone modifying enzyme n=1 Tax=Lithospermum erythrorhizon TaxID=34254 RepID=A0AAV3RWF1_LITER
MSETTPLVSPAEIPGKGRSLVATEALKAGQIVLRDSPILVYSAFPVTVDHYNKERSYCSHCFRSMSNPASAISCPCCFSAFFCNSNCSSSALSSSHSPWVCQALKRLRENASSLPAEDQQVQARFLVAAYNLVVISPANFQILMSLQGEHTNIDTASAFLLHSFISSLSFPNQAQIGFSVELTAALLAKDKLNAFGFMVPFAIHKERSVRAYAIYPRASFFNHDCLPNACRFDYVDSSDENNTDIIVRIIHDLPQGREICLSYFPVNLKYSERQCRLKEDYGFICNCDRCRVEANWSDEEDEEDEVIDEVEGEEEDDNNSVDEQMSMNDKANASAADNDFPHAYFFLRYMCNRDQCGGTLAPLPPSNNKVAVMECNVCGSLSNLDELCDG